MLTGVQIGNGIPHERYNVRGIAHARTNRKDDQVKSLHLYWSRAKGLVKNQDRTQETDNLAEAKVLLASKLLSLFVLNWHERAAFQSIGVRAADWQ